MSEKTAEQRALEAETRLMVQEVAGKNCHDDYWSLHRTFVWFIQAYHPGITDETAAMMINDYVAAHGEEG